MIADKFYRKRGEGEAKVADEIRMLHIIAILIEFYRKLLESLLK